MREGTDERMRAVVIDRPGGPEVLELREVERPTPGPGELRVRVRGSGVNRADLLQRRGRYPAPKGAPQDIPGLEYAGVVDAVGAGCTLFAVGDRVMGLVGGGGYAEHVVVHERTALPVPASVDIEDAAGVPEAFLTAWDAVFRQAGLVAGETLLVHAVGSGVGTAAVQLARRAGARVVGTSRTPEKLERAAGLGLEHAVEGGERDWAEDVLEATGGRGVDVVLDLVGGAYAGGNVRCLAGGGRWMVVGVPSGATAEVDFRGLMSRRASLTGTVLRARPLEEKAALARAFARTVLPAFEEGALRPVVDDRIPVERVAEAHRRMEENRTFGTLVVVWPG